jgi:CcmD family protein
MEESGKIFVVVAVLAVILTGLFVYLFFLDRKVRRLEKQLEEKPEKKIA